MAACGGKGTKCGEPGLQPGKAKRKAVQMIFQDPLASLDPRMTVAQIIGEPLRTHCPELSAAQHNERVLAMMLRVGLTAQQINRYPHEFSGGQCQRIGIARALILKPQVVICDEPVSALDVSIQAQIINLLKELQAEMGLALIFIAHDLAVVKHISQRVMVMYLGRAMEVARKHALYDTPRHPYTQALVVGHSSTGPYGLSAPRPCNCCKGICRRPSTHRLVVCFVRAALKRWAVRKAYRPCVGSASKA
jgi:ABC-type oligopeptide transport system ATPase subunit